MEQARGTAVREKRRTKTGRVVLIRDGAVVRGGPAKPRRPRT